MRYYVFIYFIVDASDDMRGEKIGMINNVIPSLVPDILNGADENTEIYMRTMAYNEGQYWMEKYPTPIEEYCWNDISVSDGISVSGMLAALSTEFSKFKLNKRNILLISVLFSGTTHNEDYEKDLKKLQTIPIFKAGIKVGVPIGQNADIGLLNGFTGNIELVVSANKLDFIKKLIKLDYDGPWFDNEWIEAASIDTIYTKSIESLSDIVGKKVRFNMSLDLKCVIDYSDSFSKTRQKIRAYIKDIAPELDNRMCNILLNVYESGIAKQLFLMDKILLNQYRTFVNQLEKDYGMTVESSIEAINRWIDACIKKGAGTRWGNTILKNRKEKEHSVFTPIVTTNGPFSRNECIYEDKKIKVTFLRFQRRSKFVNDREGLNAFFIIENRTKEYIDYKFIDREVGGCRIGGYEDFRIIRNNTKEVINFMCFVEADKVPGKINEFETVEFNFIYGDVIDRHSYPVKFKEFGRSGQLSLQLKDIEE